MGEQPIAGVFTTTLTQAEIFYGLALLPEGRRRDALMAAAQPMFDVDLAGRELPFDSDAANAYPEIAAERRKGGQPISQIDALIAAIVRSRGARLATRTSPTSLTAASRWSIRGRAMNRAAVRPYLRYAVSEPLRERKAGARCMHGHVDLSTWTVTDDWLDRVPVTSVEVGVFARKPRRRTPRRPAYCPDDLLDYARFPIGSARPCVGRPPSDR